MAAAEAEVVAIDARTPLFQPESVPCIYQFRFIPVLLRTSVWNCFKQRLFLLHPAACFHIDKEHHEGCLLFMIVCSCNVLTDHDVRNAVSAASDLPRNAKQIYGCLGCSAECGRCARTIKTIIDEALGACAKECCSGCPHSRHAANDEPAQEAAPAFALAAC